MNDKMQRMPGESFTARLAAPKPEPTKPASEGTPTLPSALSRPPLRSYPTSAGRQDLLPAFTRFSRSLDAELAADEAIRRGQVAGHLNLPQGAGEPKDTLAMLSAGVKSGEVTEAEAVHLFNALHPNVRPEDVK